MPLCYKKKNGIILTIVLKNTQKSFKKVWLIQQLRIMARNLTYLPPILCFQRTSISLQKIQICRKDLSCYRLGMTLKFGIRKMTSSSGPKELLVWNYIQMTVTSHGHLLEDCLQKCGMNVWVNSQESLFIWQTAQVLNLIRLSEEIQLAYNGMDIMIPCLPLFKKQLKYWTKWRLQISKAFSITKKKHYFKITRTTISNKPSDSLGVK